MRFRSALALRSILVALLSRKNSLYRQPELPASDEVEGGINGWVIVITAIAIILTAFGAGYMVVLPLLNNNNDTAQ